jgi:phosphoesterase RecJ-like protein
MSMQESLELLLQPVPTCILFHKNPDPDAVGSAFALRAFLRAAGTPAWCVCHDEVPRRLRFLTDGVQQSVKLSAIPPEFACARAVSVDTAAPAQLGEVYETFEGRIALMIDHHQTGMRFADGLVVPSAAACGEIIFDLLAESGRDVPPEAAPLLYAAISGDTGGFRYSNVTRETHLRAAALVESGVDVADISHRLFAVKSPAQIRAERRGMENLRLYRDGKIAVTTLSFAEKMADELRDEDLSTLIDIPRAVEGAEIAISVRQPEEEGIFRASLRANIDFDVSAVCAAFGGGGHRRAAGVTLTAESVEDAVQKIIDAI